MSDASRRCIHIAKILWTESDVRITDRFGSGLRGLPKLAEVGVVMETGGNTDERLTRIMLGQTGADGGSLTLLRPDATPYPGSPFTGGGLPGPWAAVLNVDDNVWISKTGEQISPPGGYVGGGLQMVPTSRSDRPATYG